MFDFIFHLLIIMNTYNIIKLNDNKYIIKLDNIEEEDDEIKINTNANINKISISSPEYKYIKSMNETRKYIDKFVHTKEAYFYYKFYSNLRDLINEHYNIKTNFYFYESYNCNRFSNISFNRDLEIIIDCCNEKFYSIYIEDNFLYFIKNLKFINAKNVNLIEFSLNNVLQVHNIYFDDELKASDDTSFNASKNHIEVKELVDIDDSPEDIELTKKFNMSNLNIINAKYNRKTELEREIFKLLDKNKINNDKINEINDKIKNLDNEFKEDDSYEKRDHCYRLTWFKNIYLRINQRPNYLNFPCGIIPAPYPLVVNFKEVEVKFDDKINKFNICLTK